MYLISETNVVQIYRVGSLGMITGRDAIKRREIARFSFDLILRKVVRRNLSWLIAIGNLTDWINIAIGEYLW